MNPSTLIQLLGVYYDLFDNLIPDIQLYAFIQGCAICCLCTKKSLCIGLLETYYLYCD